MKKENRQMLKLILSNQELIMKALNVQSSDMKTENKIEPKPVKKLPAKKAVSKVSVKKVSKKK